MLLNVAIYSLAHSIPSSVVQPLTYQDCARRAKLNCRDSSRRQFLSVASHLQNQPLLPCLLPRTTVPPLLIWKPPDGESDQQRVVVFHNGATLTKLGSLKLRDNNHLTWSDIWVTSSAVQRSRARNVLLVSSKKVHGSLDVSLWWSLA